MSVQNFLKKTSEGIDINTSDYTVTTEDATNAEMRARALLSHDGAIVQTIIPLNRYSFFEGLSDRLLPPMQLEFEIVLQDDRGTIFQNDGTARRIVVRRLELWVPQLKFTCQGQTYNHGQKCWEALFILPFPPLPPLPSKQCWVSSGINCALNIQHWIRGWGSAS